MRSKRTCLQPMTADASGAAVIDDYAARWRAEERRVLRESIGAEMTDADREHFSRDLRRRYPLYFERTRSVFDPLTDTTVRQRIDRVLRYGAGFGVAIYLLWMAVA